MTVEAMLLMTLSVSSVTVLAIWCYYKVFTTD